MTKIKIAYPKALTAEDISEILVHRFILKVDIMFNDDSTCILTTEEPISKIAKVCAINRFEVLDAQEELKEPIKLTSKKKKPKKEIIN